MKNLLITTIGDYNHTDVWYGGKYDIIPIDYRITPGFKYPLLYEELQRRTEYDYYWMPDEDIYATPDQIEALFDNMARHSLDLGQPSVEKSEQSFPSWSMFIHTDDDRTLVRTRFVEIMCPCFSRYGLDRCINTFSKSNSGWGLDLVWAKLLNYRGMGFFNDVVIRHTRRPTRGSDLYDKLHEPAGKEMRRVMTEYGLTDIIAE